MHRTIRRNGKEPGAGEFRGTWHADAPGAHERPQPPRRSWMLAAATLVAVAAIVAVGVGWDAGGWLADLWRSLGRVSFLYLVPALGLQMLQTVFSSAAWYGILRYAYPDSEVRGASVLACCATGIALNNLLPASGGTLVAGLMLVATISAATLPGIVAAVAVEKLFYAVAAVLLNVYLFFSVGGSFKLKFGFVAAHPWATAMAAAAVAAALVVAGRVIWRWLRGLWEQARQGGRILSNPRAYLRHVVFPQFLSWCSRLGVIAVLLAAYGIPVSFQAVTQVVAGNSLASTVSVTPGSIGVSQAFSVASLHGTSSAAAATAYSVGSQLLVTAWNLALALVLLAVVFGWSTGKRLVVQSLRGAREHEARGPVNDEQRASEASPGHEAAAASQGWQRDGSGLAEARTSFES
jgi:uncharacterized membrane protein YbhN (UPF0104 family)